MAKPLTPRQRLFRPLHRFTSWLNRVTAIAVGKTGDGLGPMTTGAALDRTWDGEEGQRALLGDALTAWRVNPLARRLIGITSAYVVGQGITLTAEYGPLKRYLAKWWAAEKNLMDLRLTPLCDELSRSGELFLTLHMNPADGISYVRPLPAAVIDKITWAPGDYENTQTYHEAVGLDDPDYDQGGRIWYAPSQVTDTADAAGRYQPMLLHFPVNRVVGCVRGDGDLFPILPWLSRYALWLDDRVSLNAAVRLFLWIVKVPKGDVATRRAQLTKAPKPGSVLVVDKDNESWEAVAPNLHANDAQADGRAIRWMIAAGGPGTGLVDLGEADDANLATATSMADQRTRFLQGRQAFFGYVLARTGLESYNRAVRAGLVRGRVRMLTDIRIGFSDLSAADNAALGQAAERVASALKIIHDMGVQGNAFQRLALRVILRFAGEQVGEMDLDALLAPTPTPKSEP